MDSTTNSNYIFADHQDDAEWQRLQQIETIFDPRTRGFLQDLGIDKGHHCLEIGFGACGVLQWMLEQVGPSGHVTGVDLSTTFLRGLSAANLTIHEASILDQEIAADSFDFIHGRYVFVFVPEIRAVLKKLRNALKPGGWILLEEIDFSCARPNDPTSIGGQAFVKLREAIRVMFASDGMDYSFGRQLASLLPEAGFRNVAKEHYAPTVPGGSAVAELMRVSSLKLRDVYERGGAITATAFDAYLDFCCDPEQTATHYDTISSWGQK